MVASNTEFAYEMKKVATDMLEEFGEPRGTIVIAREVKGAIDPNNPSAGPQTEIRDYPCTGFFTTYELVDHEYVQRGNAFMIIDVDSIDIEPSTDDKAKFLNKTYNIEQIDPIRASGVTVLYTLKVKA